MGPSGLHRGCVRRYAFLYLGDVLAYSGGSGGYTEVVGVRGARGGVCGVLAVRVDQLPVLHRALSLSHSYRDLPRASASHPHSSMMPTFQVTTPHLAATATIHSYLYLLALSLLLTAEFPFARVCLESIRLTFLNFLIVCSRLNENQNTLVQYSFLFRLKF